MTIPSDKIVEVKQFSNSVEIVGYRTPASLQSSRSKKAQAKQLIAALARETDRIFLGDVSVEIEWLINDEERYLGDAPDVDNIIKPILDAMCGPAGILIDDVQVQQIDVRWMGGWDPVSGPRYQYRVRIAPVTGSFVWREGLTFVKVGVDTKVCYAVPCQPGLNEKVQERFLARFAYRAHQGRQESCRQEMGVSAMPFLPRRVQNFPVRDISEIPLPDGWEFSTCEG